jgi:MFS family permease
MREVKKLYIANFLTGIVFWYPIEKLFLRSIGVTPFQIGVNAVVFLIITLAFDIPAGVLADRWKRSYTLILALISLALSHAVMGFSTKLLPYLIGSVLFGCYVVLSSGTFQAYMYDLLDDLGIAKNYDKHQGRAYALFLAGVGFSSLAGGYIAAGLGYRANYFLSIVSAVLTVCLLLSMHEPKHHKKTHNDGYLKHIGQGFKALKKTPLTFHLSLFVVIAGLIRSTQNEFAGLYYIALGLTAIPTGYANAAKWLSGSLGQIIARRLGRSVLALIPLFYLTFGLFSIIGSSWGFVPFFAAVFMHGVLQNQAEAEIQSHIDTSVRATTLSSLSFLTNALLVPVGLLFGWLSGKYSALIAYRLVAAIGCCYLLIWVVRSRKILGSLSNVKPISEPFDMPESAK